jgi:hypothetical protein
MATMIPENVEQFILICFLSVMYYNRLSPPSFVEEGQYYIRIGYPNVFMTDFYCCGNNQFRMVAGLDSDDKTDLNWTIKSRCYKVETHELNQKQ